MSKVRARDIDMYYETYGKPNAEPLVLLHGFTGTGEKFDPFVEELAERYRVYVPDWRGHGRTTNPSGNIIHAELARDTAAFVAALGISRAHFCGHSSGGMQLLFLALEQPDIVHSLTLVSATYTFDDHTKAEVQQARDSAPSEWIKRLEDRHGKTHGSGYAHTLLDLWATSVFRPDELPFTKEDLRRITCPTLIVHGDRDGFFPVHVPVTMYEAIQNAELCILPHCGHSALSKSPTLFLTVLLDFLTRHPFTDSGEAPLSP